MSRIEDYELQVSIIIKLSVGYQPPGIMQSRLRVYKEAQPGTDENQVTTHLRNNPLKLKDIEE